MKDSSLLRLVLAFFAVAAFSTGAAGEPGGVSPQRPDSIEGSDESGGAGARDDGGGQPPAARRGVHAVEEIVVRARKREELLEDTPISVTALGESALRESGVMRLDEIETLVPNLTFQSDNTGAQTNIRIRGVGTSTTEIAFDPGVGIYVDGVFLPRSLGTLMDVVDVQQIEVLRGPQGTLFGKNTVGGAINITTVKPAEDFETFLMVRPGNYDRVDTRFTLNAPIGPQALRDRLLLRMSFASTNTSGYSYNDFRKESLNNRDSLAFLGALRFIPVEDITVDLTGSWSRDHNNGIAQRCVVARRDAPLGSLLPPGTYEECERTSPFVTTANVASITDLESYGTWAVANWEVGEVPWLGETSLKTLASWREQVPRTRFDIDGTSFPIAQVSNVGGGSILDGGPGFQRQIQVEEQLTAAALDDRLHYVAGAFGFWEEGDAGDRVTYVLPSSLNQVSEAVTDIDNWTWALFGQATFDVFDWLSLTGGIRYTQDKKGLTYLQFNPRNDAVNANEAGSKVFDAWTPMASIAATLPDELIDATPFDHAMGYFTYSQGFKGGGFNGVATGPASPVGAGVAFAYEPETLDNFEVGFKLIGFEQRATLNVSFFLGKYEDIQVTQLVQVGVGPGGAPDFARLTDNAAEGTTEGFEIELQATPVDGLAVTGSIGYTHAEYDDFTDAVSDYDGNLIDRSGDRFLYSPRLQSFIGIQYSFEIPGLREYGWLTPRVEWAYTSSIEWLGPEVPEATQSGYNLLNTRLSYTFWDDRAEIAMWAKNLLDEAYFTNVTPIASTFGIITQAYAAPRTYGAEVLYRFN